jgi:hypothetical protein
VFGTWNAAIRAAGLTTVGPGNRRVTDPHELDRSRYWNEKRIVVSIRLWAVRHGRPPYLDEWRCAAPGRPCVSTVKRRFGSWNSAIEAAGFAPRDRCATLRQNEPVGDVA